MATPTTLSPEHVDAVLAHLGATSPRVRDAEGVPRRPVHVVYGGAHLFTRDTPAKLTRLARAAWEAHAADEARFAESVGLGDPALAGELGRRVRRKLEDAPVEAMCIDFEDGYGPRPDAEEDADAIRAAGELAALGEGGPVVGLRVKALNAETGRRAVRTLDLFVTALAAATSAKLRPGFTVTLPKIAGRAEVAALASLLTCLEDALSLRRGAIGVELMIESPGCLVDADGRVPLVALVAAAEGRAIAAHLGAYDLTAAAGVAAADQRLDHPLCDAARAVMLFALHGRGVAVVDGATTRVAAKDADTDAVHEIWALHARNVRRALALGITQGWDLHPSHLPARYGALFAFFLEQRAAMAARLAAFVVRATQATRSGQVFDDAATGQGLLNFFLRGLAAGALDEADLAATGLSTDELRARSFSAIVSARAERGEA